MARIVWKVLTQPNNPLQRLGSSLGFQQVDWSQLHVAAAQSSTPFPFRPRRVRLYFASPLLTSSDSLIASSVLTLLISIGCCRHRPMRTILLPWDHVKEHPFRSCLVLLFDIENGASHN